MKNEHFHIQMSQNDSSFVLYFVELGTNGAEHFQDRVQSRSRLIDFHQQRWSCNNKDNSHDPTLLYDIPCVSFFPLELKEHTENFI